MSAVSKGNGFELEVKKILENDGWTVFRQHRKPMFMKGKMITVGADVFGCDIIAKRQSDLTLYIQVSTRKNKSEKIKQVRVFPWNTLHEKLQLWLRTDGKREFEVFEYPTFESVGVRECVKK